MTGLFHALRLPFTNVRRLCIGALLLMIPGISLITGLFAIGYLLEFLRKPQLDELPAWIGLGHLFLDGLKSFALSLIWFLPALIVGLLVFGKALFSVGALTSSIGAFGSLLVLLLFAATMYLVPSALLAFANTSDFVKGLDVVAVVRRALTKQYFVQWLLMLLVTFGANLVLGIAGIILALLGPLAAPLVIVLSGFISFISSVSGFTLLGHAYTSGAPARGAPARFRANGSRAP